MWQNYKYNIVILNALYPNWLYVLWHFFFSPQSYLNIHLRDTDNVLSTPQELTISSPLAIDRSLAIDFFTKTSQGNQYEFSSVRQAQHATRAFIFEVAQKIEVESDDEDDDEDEDEDDDDEEEEEEEEE